ncbi:MAG: hypothetical protein ACM3N3_14400, partial [Betaproteobacteria bacterium]
SPLLQRGRAVGPGDFAADRNFHKSAPRDDRNKVAFDPRAQEEYVLSKNVLDPIFGRWRSQILYASVKLGVFDTSGAVSKRRESRRSSISIRF